MSNALAKRIAAAFMGSAQNRGMKFSKREQTIIGLACSATAHAMVEITGEMRDHAQEAVMRNGELESRLANLETRVSDIETGGS